MQILSQPKVDGLVEAEDWLLQALATVSADEKVNVLTDLAAVRITLAEHTGNTDLLLQSIEDSYRALDLSPGAAVPRFNLALALSELGVSQAASRHWAHLLAGGAAGSWADEVRRHRAALPSSDGVGRCRTVEERLSAAAEAGDGAALSKAVEMDRQCAREWGENRLLPRWGRAWNDGDDRTAARALTAARELASKLARVGGDHLLVDAVEAIEQAAPARRADLARAHRDHGDLRLPTAVVARYARGASSDVSPATVARLSIGIRDAYSRGDSPFSLWAEFDRGRAVFDQGLDPEGVLRELAGKIERGRYPVLAARISWIRGLAFSRRNLVGESNVQYEAAVRTFCELGEKQNLAATQGLLAAGKSKEGDAQAAWTLSRSALRLRDRISNLQRLWAILDDAANNAHRQGRLRAGFVLADELLPIALRQGKPQAIRDGYLRRAALAGALGRWELARADLGHALRVPSSADRTTFSVGKATACVTDEPRAGDDAARDRNRADICVEQARDYLTKGQAESADRSLTAAIAIYRAGAVFQKLPQAHGLRAVARLRIGDAEAVKGAEEDLVEQAKLLEASLFASPPGPERQDRLRVLRESFDQMVSFHAVAKPDPEKAFHYAERQRHWALWEWARSQDGAGRSSTLVVDPLAVVSWKELQKVQDGNRAAVVYHHLPDRLVIWVSRRGQARMHVSEAAPRDPGPALRDQTREWIRALVSAADRRSSAAAREPARALHRTLIQPVRSDIGDATTVLVVPDPLLQDLPFGLLLGNDGRHLYADAALVYSPSATAYARLALAGQSTAVAPLRALAVAGSVGAQPRWSLLPRADEEADAVAAAWPGGKATSFRELEPLRQQLAVSGVFHFAGHGLVVGNSLRLVLHDDAQAVELTAADLTGQRCPYLRLVSLSGCHTIDVQPAGSRYTSSPGFVRLLLASGVRTVVGSFLALDDRSAEAVFTAFHRRLAGGEDPARALRGACLAMGFSSANEKHLLCGSLATFGFSAPIDR